MVENDHHTDGNKNLGHEVHVRVTHLRDPTACYHWVKWFTLFLKENLSLNFLNIMLEFRLRFSQQILKILGFWGSFSCDNFSYIKNRVCDSELWFWKSSWLSLIKLHQMTSIFPEDNIKPRISCTFFTFLKAITQEEYMETRPMT